MSEFQVITVASPSSIPPGEIVGIDTESDTPVVIAHAGHPPLQGAEIVVINDTPPSGGEGDPEALANHINDSTPHPSYDDMPSLTLLFQNGLV